MGGSSTISTEAPRIGALRIQQSSFGVARALVYGRNRISGNMLWYGDFKAIPHVETQQQGGKGGGGVKQTNTTYTYQAAVMLALGEGSIPRVVSAWRGKEQYSDKPGQTVLDQLGLSLAVGQDTQGVWGYLSTNHPTQALNYSGLAYLYGATYQLSDNAEVHNHTFEVDGKLPYSDTIPDANLADVIADLLPSDRYGAAFPASRIGDLTWYSDYVRALGLFASPALTEQREAREWLAEWARMTNSAPVWSGGLLRMIPYGDAPASGNGANFTPDTTPQYDLADDDFIRSGNEDPVRMERRSPADAYNRVTIEFVNRSNGYNIETVEASDLRAIELYGERAADAVQMHSITSPAVARAVAQLLLQRHLYIRNTYRFRLGWRYCRLEPMDLVTLTDEGLGLSRTTVRIIEVTEPANGPREFVAEDWPLGVASATYYDQEQGSGFSHDYNADPGSVTTPVFFESQVDASTTGLEVLAAVSGATTDWGGCAVWASLDGDSYKRVGTVVGGARYGTLSAAMGAGVDAACPVTLVGQGGQMLSGTADEANALQTLCWVGQAGVGEYFAHTTATLTGSNAYTLTAAKRGAFKSPVSAHAAGAQFVRVDDALASSGPLDPSLVGSTIFFKFTSFNVYGGGEQGLADVPEYTYTITGQMLKLAPDDVTGFDVTADKFNIRLQWVPINDPDLHHYELREGGTSWETATFLTALNGTNYSIPVRVQGTYTFWVKAVDNYGSPSDNAASDSITIAIPAPSNLVASISGPDLVLAWDAVDAAYSIDYYELRYGAAWDTGTRIDRAFTNSRREKVTFGGARTFWVAAVDVAGNVGTPASVDITIAAPGAVTGTRADVVDNNALLYWAPPLTGTLPVDHYEVRKGASWAAGVSFGSNGNSTFTTIFEQVAGTYTYWIAAYDTAGNLGPAASLVATINQPPDYVLRNNFDSTFTGTLTNTYLEGGTLLGPVTPETWAAHFSGRSWASIQDQINAGYPLYANPSATSGTYQETIDYGGTIGATMVTVTPGLTVLQGAVTLDVQIDWKLNVGDAWTALPAGANGFVPQSFRYLRVTLTLTATAGANLARVGALNIKLANKLKTDQGMGNAVSTDSGGTVVTFTQAFVDVSSITVTPQGTGNVIAIYDFVDAPNPTSFKVLLLNPTNGTRVSGPFSWTARGF